MKSASLKEITTVLSRGDVAILATDTIYGIVGQALRRDTVEKIYALKKRTPTKPFIILISSFDDTKKFGIQLTDTIIERLNAYWPGPVSIILDCQSAEFEYLHRGSYSLAFRFPAKKELLDIITETGPLVAPSANPEGLTPANNTQEAFDYFGDSIAAYREGITSTKPSKIVKLTENGEKIIRP